MIDLSDRLWKELEGGQGILYDASRPLRKLADLTDPGQIQLVFDELWDNLYHQGKVGLASYLALPALVSLCISRKSFDWNYIGLCVAIEIARVRGGNPELPQEYDDLYFGAVNQFESYLLSNFKSINDDDSRRCALALFATVNGQPDLGHAIQVLDRKALVDFVSTY